VNIGTATVIRGDARNLPLPDDSVDLIVTSPPYFALRSYQDGGQHYAGQIGDESTPAEFVDSLIEVTRECVRVLKPSGSLWVNLGDKYSGAQAQNTLARKGDDAAATWRQTDPRRTGIPNKSLMGIPWRYALRCIDDLGLILRAEVIWSKPNGLPESVTDRVRRSHEQWFHFTLEPRYFSAVDEVREAHTTTERPRGLGGLTVGSTYQAMPRHTFSSLYSPLGKLPGSVRTVPTEPLRVPDHLGVDHFAAFPTAWPKWIIQGWAPTRGVCEACGGGRRPVVQQIDKAYANARAAVQQAGLDAKAASRGHKVGRGAATAGAASMIGNGVVRPDYRTTGEACACPEPTAATTPPTILDPFGGTGTTALVAKALGCHGISVDMSADYCRLAEWRTNDPGQLAKVLDVDKPPEVAANQTDLFDLIGGDAA
jgi:DNA modification methylase